MKRNLLRVLAVAVVVSPAVAITQSKPTAATYITKEEVDTVNKEGQGTDRTIRVVDIGTENFAVGIIHRPATAATAAAGAARGAAAASGAGAARGAARGGTGTAGSLGPCGEQMATLPANGTPGLIAHDSQTEGYYIVSGGGTLITGGRIVNGRKSPSPDINGPTCGGGVTIGDVVKKVVKTGDIIIIPAGVPHGWTDIGDHVDYLSFRPSPNILTAGYVHPTLKK
jgi:hypothetical protein